MNRGQKMLIGIALLFMAPLALSFILYYGFGGLVVSPAGRLNHGQLLQPARPLAHVDLTLADGSHAGKDFLRHRWTLLFVGEGSCDARCVQALHDTQQIRLLLNRDMGRVQRLFLATGECCDMAMLKREHPDLTVARAAPQDALLAQLPGEPGDLYIIDPLGNLVMRYGPAVPPKGLLADLKHLLKLSQIG